MESLHLSFGEVMDVIPYRVLTVMSRDRLHTVHGEKVVRMTGREMAQRRNGKKN